ncbi:hypothetical protein D3C72_2069980 [compost metagenome]
MAHRFQFAPGQQLAQAGIDAIAALQPGGLLAVGMGRVEGNGHPGDGGKPGQRRTQRAGRDIELRFDIGLRPRRRCHQRHPQRNGQRHPQHGRLYGAIQRFDG